MVSFEVKVKSGFLWRFFRHSFLMVLCHFQVTFQLLPVEISRGTVPANLLLEDSLSIGTNVLTQSVDAYGLTTVLLCNVYLSSDLVIGYCGC